MPELPKQNPEREIPQELLEEFIMKARRAILEAPTAEEHYHELGKRTRAVRKWLKGEKSDFVPSQLGVVEFSDQAIFSAILKRLGAELGKGEGELDELAEHEKSHFLTAVEEGFDPKFCIEFFREKDGKFNFNASVFVGGITSAEKLKKIIKSPGDDKFSDEEMLKE